MGYPPGNVIRLTGDFFEEDGVTPIDPTSVVAMVHFPDTSTKQYTAARDGVGQYHYDLTVTEPGYYIYRFLGTGVVQAQSPDKGFRVDEQAF